MRIRQCSPVITPLRKTPESLLRSLPQTADCVSCRLAGSRLSLLLCLWISCCLQSLPQSLPLGPNHRPTVQPVDTNENAQTHEMRLCVSLLQLSIQERDRHRNTSHAPQGLGLPLKLVQLLFAHAVEFLGCLKHSIKCSD